jgi:hypothetical protein
LSTRQAIDLKGAMGVLFMLRSIELLLAFEGVLSILELVDTYQHSRSMPNVPDAQATIQPSRTASFSLSSVLNPLTFKGNVTHDFC